MEIGLIEDMLSDEAIEEICQSGDSDKAVKKWTAYYLHDLGQMDICPFACRDMLMGYGFGSVENNMQWIERAIWCAAWNVFERREEV